MNFSLITVLDTSEASHWGLPDGFTAVGREIVIIIIMMITITILNSYTYIVMLVPKDLRLVYKQGSLLPATETGTSEEGASVAE